MFICKNCGRELSLKVVAEYTPFTKAQFLQSIKEGDFSTIMSESDDYVLVTCYACGHPALSKKDYKLLNEYFTIIGNYFPSDKEIEVKN